MVEKIEFRGTGQEYFKILITNIFLTVLTLGLFHPWAMVRKRKFFYNNLYLLDNAFDYTANPVSILKGYILIIVIYVVSLSFIFLNPVIGFITYLFIILALMPYFMLKAFRFRAYHTRYRNIRFHFEGDFKSLYKLVIGYSVLAIITFGLIFPLFYFKLKKYYFNNLYFGSIKVEEELESGPFYTCYLSSAFVGGLIIILLSSVLMGIFEGYFEALEINTADIYKITEVVSNLSIFLIGIVVSLAINKYIWNNVSLPNMLKVRCNYSTFKMSMISIFYLGISLLTFGLFLPFRKVLMMKLILNKVEIEFLQEKVELESRLEQESSSIGEVSSDFFDFDGGFDFGF